MTTTLHGILAIDVKDTTAQRFVLRVPQINRPDSRPLMARDIQGSYDVPLAAGQVIRVFNSAVVSRNLCDIEFNNERHGDLMAAFYRAALPVLLHTANEPTLGRLVPNLGTQGHNMSGWGFEAFTGTSHIIPIHKGDTLTVFENVSLGHVVHEGAIATDTKPFKDGGYRSEDTGRRIDGCFPITLTSPRQMVMKIYASRGLPAEITCP